jgi:ribosomal protein S19
LIDYVDNYSTKFDEYYHPLFDMKIFNKEVYKIVPRPNKIQDITELKKMNNFRYKIYNRSLMVNSLYKRFFFYIHKGNAFRELKYRVPLNTFKFGEFSFTRKPFSYPIKDKKKKFSRR